MRRKIFFILFVILLFNIDNVYAQDLRIYFNNQEIKTDQPAIIVNERTLVPVRAFFEKIGAKVIWDDSDKTAYIVQDDKNIRLRVNDNTAYVNNEPYHLDVSAQIINDRILVPIRFISENLDYDVTFNDKEYKIFITSNTSGSYKSKIYKNIYSANPITEDQDWIYISNGFNKEEAGIYKINKKDNQIIKMSDDRGLYLTLSPSEEKLYYRNTSNFDCYTYSIDINTYEKEVFFPYNSFVRYSDNNFCVIENNDGDEHLVFSYDYNNQKTEIIERGIQYFDGREYWIEKNGDIKQICSLELNGSDKKKHITVPQETYQFVTDNNVWVYYNESKAKEQGLYIYSDALGIKQLTNESIKEFFIYQDRVYYSSYIDEDYHSPIYSVKFDGTDKQLLTDKFVSTEGMCVIDNKMYYFYENEYFNTYIARMNLDGSKKEIFVPNVGFTS